MHGRQPIPNAEKVEVEIPKNSIAFVPATEDDDSYFINWAMKKQAIVISNDRFRDHEERFEGDSKKQFVEWRKTHRCGFTFVLGEFEPNPSFIVPTNAQSNLEPTKIESSDNEIIQWLENQMKTPIALSTLSQRIMKKYGGKSPRVSIREIGGINGKTLMAQLKTIFGTRLNLSEEGHVVCVVDGGTKPKPTTNQTTPPSISENISEDLAISTVLDILGVPVSSRLVKPTTNVWFWLSWLRGARRTTTYKTHYASVGEHFKELTGHKLKSVFSSPEDICKRIAKSYPSLSASVTPHPNNELVIVAHH